MPSVGVWQVPWHACRAVAAVFALPRHPFADWHVRSGAAFPQFGLRAREIVAVVNRLAEEGMLDCLNLLHFHVGSQITNIRM